MNEFWETGLTPVRVHGGTEIYGRNVVEAWVASKFSAFVALLYVRRIFCWMNEYPQLISRAWKERGTSFLFTASPVFLFLDFLSHVGSIYPPVAT